MTEQELKQWFWNKFNSCYPVKHTDYKNRIFFFCDDNVIRKMKLCRLSGENFIQPKKVTGVCLFDLDMNNKWFRCDSNKIWTFLETNYKNSYIDIVSCHKRMFL